MVVDPRIRRALAEPVHRVADVVQQRGDDHRIALAVAFRQPGALQRMLLLEQIPIGWTHLIG
jgi:hypothetical protein